MPRRTCWTDPINPETLVIGIDVAKASHTAVATHADGRMSKPLVFASDEAGFERLRTHVERWQVQFGATASVIAMEPTGHYGHALAAWCTKQGWQVFAVQPQHTNRAKELFDGTQRKTDAKDAAVIAGLCRRGVARVWRILKEPFATARILSRRREQLVVERTQIANRLHGHVDTVFPELRGLVDKLLSATSLWLMRHVPTPAALLAMGEEALVAGLRRASRGQLGRERAEALIAAAKASVGVNVGIEAHMLAIRQLLDELEVVLRQVAETEREMNQVLAHVPYAGRLLSVPRLGRVTVVTLLGEFGDLRDYRVARQLHAMAGLDLVETSSGEQRGRRRISRRGRRYVRQMLYLAALRLGGSVLKEPRRRLVEVNKVQATKAAVANMCRLLRILHALVRDDVDFEAARYATLDEAQAA